MFSRFAAFFCAMLLSVTLFTTVFAASPKASPSVSPSPAASPSESVAPSQSPAVTTPQTSDTAKKWEELTDKQKSEIYELNNKIADLEFKMLEKYAQWGVIDKDTQTEVKSRIQAKNDRVRKEGKMPRFFMRKEAMKK